MAQTLEHYGKKLLLLIVFTVETLKGLSHEIEINYMWYKATESY
jgi:hypothetical protein